MLKQLTLIFLIAISGSVLAQQIGPQNKNVVGKVHISGQIVGAGDQNVDFGNQNKGGVRAPLLTVKLDEDGKFAFDYDLPFEDYYFLKFENNQLLNLILHAGDSLKVYGDIKDIMDLSNVVGSEDSEVMNQFISTYASFNKVKDSLTRVIRVDRTKGPEVDAYFKPIAEDFYQKRNNFINKFSSSPAIVVTLNAIDQDREWKLYKTVVELLTKSFPQSPTIQNIAKQTTEIIKQKEARKFLEPGNLAKDIALPNPEGDTLRLSELKGSVVLLDFWASWCAPCRRENPNVVNLYHTYKDEGFTVYSVSLDKDGQKWKGAIEQDGLVWPYHVSDLKYWNSVAAKAYMVKTIPFTVLIDREGKIIGTNIRGAELANQLKTIFGH